MIIHPRQQQIPLLRALWKDVFHDSDDFLDLYFSMLHLNENSLILMEEGRLCASLQLIPCSFVSEGNRISAVYIFAVMTSPEYRHKGYMDALMRAAFTELKAKNVSLALLIPQEPYLFDVYAKYGFRPTFHLSEKEITLPDTKQELIVFKPSIEESYAFYVSHYENLSHTIIPSFSHFKTVFRSLEQEGGYILALSHFDSIAALCFAIKSNHSLKIIDLIASSSDFELLLLSNLKKLTGFERAMCKKRDITNSNKTFGMACILDDSKLTWTNLEEAYMSLMMND